MGRTYRKARVRLSVGTLPPPDPPPAQSVLSAGAINKALNIGKVLP